MTAKAAIVDGRVPLLPFGGPIGHTVDDDDRRSGRLANYTIGEAALLAGVKLAKLRRWIRNPDGPASSGVFHFEGEVMLEFGALAEAAVGACLAAQGATNREIALVVRAARSAFGGPHALACLRFVEEGADLVASAVGDDVAPASSSRHIAPIGYGELDHDSSGSPIRWWPKGRERGVVVDPARAGGRVVEATSFVPVAPLVSSVGAEGSVARAAAIWEVEEAVVQRALAFHALYGMRELP